MLGSTSFAQVVLPPGNSYTSHKDTTLLWKLPLSKKASPGFDQDRFTWKKGPLVWGKSTSKEEARALAAEPASIDPGILYNPKESRQPAGIVIIPQKEIDPHMAYEIPDAQRQIPGAERIALKAAIRRP